MLRWSSSESLTGWLIRLSSLRPNCVSPLAKASGLNAASPAIAVPAEQALVHRRMRACGMATISNLMVRQGFLTGERHDD